ncbi:uncharacterized protein FMAN_14361 [Fusarium mangiferae]|uniref:NAD(P)-binding domain-containing protein n=1 Tax=Fusarium mangiferae TaxID=192010 RepID=A0A1L7UAK1_FUSMA|nr:uncharacterized protein FMAN_14361 [Fusarium mangiferae]CVL07439.1 uncharacterized protein FMAN_14361 [Fusarium mangiferae]
MPVVAIAGGTGSVGRFIAEETIADGNFEVIILSRRELGARILPIDYSNPDGITSLLEDNHVDVVVAALSGHTPPELEIGLIQAAAKSKATKRYIPSVWGVKYRPEHSWFFNAAAKLSLFDALEKTDLEWTAVANGFFLDYWGNLKTYLDPQTTVFDIPARKAAMRYAEQRISTLHPTSRLTSSSRSTYHILDLKCLLTYPDSTATIRDASGHTRRRSISYAMRGIT